MKILRWLKERNVDGWVLFLLGIYLVLLIKSVTVREWNDNVVFGTYSISVSVYILTRFIISFFYEPEDESFDMNFLPSVTFAVPSLNEEENIRQTILRIAQSDYPKDKFDIVAVNDGSTDRTYLEMLAGKKDAGKLGVDVKVVNWEKNRGKREGMAECIAQSNKDIVVFIDSDSFIEPYTLRELVKYFKDETVAAVAGHAFVANEDTNLLTKMQAVRYYVAFRAYKAAESAFGSVTCCSGCCSAYRRKYLLQIIERWRNQTFLGTKCTYGDDRSLTNFLLEKGYKALYSPTATSHTFVPDTYKKFMKQQLRWKKSWVRESLKALTFIWKRNPIMSLSFFAGVVLPLVAPVVVLRSIIWYPIMKHEPPYLYLFGLFLMAFIYGIYYYIYTRNKNWVYGVVFATFYTLVLIWQLPYAILNLRDTRWGTR